jgi:hypothetical protein
MRHAKQIAKLKYDTQEILVRQRRRNPRASQRSHRLGWFCSRCFVGRLRSEIAGFVTRGDGTSLRYPQEPERVYCSASSNAVMNANAGADRQLHLAALHRRPTKKHEAGMRVQCKLSRAVQALACHKLRRLIFARPLFGQIVPSNARANTACKSLCAETFWRFALPIVFEPARTVELTLVGPALASPLQP